MRTIITTLSSVSPYSQSKSYKVEKLPKEAMDDYEKRTWRERCHVNPEGFIQVPAMAFKNCLDEAAKYSPKKIPGQRNATYTKHFEAGIMVTDSLVLPIKKDDVQGEWLFLNADGKRGSGTRVWKCYPVIQSWSGDVTWYVFDETVTLDVFKEVLVEAGKFIGLGRFRPRNRGYYGRFEVIDVVEV